MVSCTACWPIARAICSTDVRSALCVVWEARRLTLASIHRPPTSSQISCAVWNATCSHTSCVRLMTSLNLHHVSTAARYLLVLHALGDYGCVLRNSLLNGGHADPLTIRDFTCGYYSPRTRPSHCTFWMILPTIVGPPTTSWMPLCLMTSQTHLLRICCCAQGHLSTGCCACACAHTGAPAMPITPNPADAGAPAMPGARESHIDIDLAIGIEADTAGAPTLAGANHPHGEPESDADDGAFPK